MPANKVAAKRRSSEIVALERDMQAANKEADALRRSPAYKARQAEEVAAALKAFSAKVGGDTMAAQLLGFASKRSFDNAKQGRGFANPVMLFLALRNFND